jgi:thiamine-monophosphate kinase
MNRPRDKTPPRLGEFEMIARVFAPLARGVSGAFDLGDDVAILKPPPGHEVVLKTDSLIETIHFRHDDPASSVARKALRRALSDLAAKGAEPAAYLLALALPPWPEMAWLEEFGAGLAADQAQFGVSLVGGETNATPGPLTITITAVGYVPDGRLIRRKGARVGDLVFVTGTIGDAGAGLAILNREPGTLSSAEEFLISRYRLPVPRLAFGQALRGAAHSTIDVSDGLIADLGHVAEVSGVRIEVDVGAIPLSAPLRELGGDSLDSRSGAATAGDDYEIAFTAAEIAMEAIREATRLTATQVTLIGRVAPGYGVSLLDAGGAEISVERRGYTHF